MKQQPFDPDRLNGGPPPFGYRTHRREADDAHLQFLRIRNHKLWQELEERRAAGKAAGK